MAPAGERMRAKRVTDLLDEKAKARLRGDDYSLAGSLSSGSEHEGGELSGFVDGFFFSDNEDDGRIAVTVDGAEREHNDAGSEGSEEEDGNSLPPVPVVAMIRALVKPSSGFRRQLAAYVTKAAERLTGLRHNRPAFRRAVMSSLRESGYNAGICKARWESRGNTTAGSYEYIDVVTPATQPSEQQQKRYIVDVEFAGEFEIARPTLEYGRALAELPRVYVGRPDELRRLLRVLADAAKRSLRGREMYVPPWRKSRYMQAKWLGPYRRTVNPVLSGATATPAAASPLPSFTTGRDVKSRRVGFDMASQRLIPPATREIDMSR